MRIVSVLYLILLAYLAYLFYAAFYGEEVNVAFHDTYYMVLSPQAMIAPILSLLAPVLIIIGRWRLPALGLMVLLSAWGMYGFVTDSALPKDMAISQQLFLVSEAWFFGPITLFYTALSGLIYWLGRR